jgi:hypothetical protein
MQIPGCSLSLNTQVEKDQKVLRKIPKPTLPNHGFPAMIQQLLHHVA